MDRSVSKDSVQVDGVDQSLDLLSLEINVVVVGVGRSGHPPCRRGESS